MILLLLLLTPLHAAPCFSGSEIKLGLMFSSKETSMGPKSGELRDGYQYAINRINGAGGITCGGSDYTLKITSEVDDLSNKSTAKETMETLIGMGPDFVLAPYSSGISLAATEATNANNMVIIYPGASSDALFSTPVDGNTLPYDPNTNDKYGSYNFGLFTPASMYQAAVIDKIAQTNNDAKVCIVTWNSAFPQAVADGALKYAKEKGLAVHGDQVFVHEQDDQVTIDLHLKGCLDGGADVLLACTNKIWDAEGYVKGVRDIKWWPKVFSVTVYGAQHSFVDTEGHGDYIINLAGPTQWSADLTSSGSDSVTGWGSPRDVADDWKAKGYGLGTGVPGDGPSQNPPTYQGAGAIAAILTLSNAIKAAGASVNTDGSGAAITNTHVRDALYLMDMSTFWGRIAFQPSGQLMGETGTKNTDASVKPMYATQVQLNNKGEIPVVLPASYASKKLDSCTENCDQFVFRYPSVTAVAYGEGLLGSGTHGELSQTKLKLAECQSNQSDDLQDCNQDLSDAQARETTCQTSLGESQTKEAACVSDELTKARKDLADEKDKADYKAPFVACLILNIVLLLGIAIFMLMPKSKVIVMGDDGGTKA